MPKVSVIIPVYNVEPYLRRCLDSVIGQTLRDIDIICVNDCSPDNCAGILKEYAAKDPQFKIINHKRNRGLSAARNTGMGAATGEYIYFIDSDDWIDNDYIEAMLTVAERENINIVMNSNMLCEYENGESKWLYQEIGFHKTGFIAVADHINDISHTTCSYLWRRDFLETVHANFPEGLAQEDLYFQQTTLVHLDYIFLINSPAYHYYRRNDSIMGLQTGILHGYDIIYIIEMIYEYFIAHNLLNRFKINFYAIFGRILRFSNRDIAFIKTKNLFMRMADDIKSRYHLYKGREIVFFESVLAASDSSDFEKKYNILIYKANRRELFSKLRNGLLAARQH
jgi:glycosyltransferase involved in cell wall biosynthesis